MNAPSHGELEAVYRAEFGAVVASLTARFRDLDLAEEMAQEAFVEAVRRFDLKQLARTGPIVIRESDPDATHDDHHAGMHPQSAGSPSLNSSALTPQESAR